MSSRRDVYGTGLAIALRHTPSLIHHLSYTTLSHTIFRTPSFTHNFVTYHLWHTTVSHTIFHTPLCHTPSFTHRHRPSFTHHLWHTALSYTIFGTPSVTHNFLTHHLSHTPLRHMLPSTHNFHTHTHHLSHTRQEWIIIWSGRNWILKHAD